MYRSSVPAFPAVFPHARTFAPIAVLAAAAMLCLCVYPVRADVFTIPSVRTDVTAADAAKAKIEAIEQAQLAAFQQLIARLTPAGSEGLLPEFRGSDVARIMSGMTVEDEQTGPQRYIATLTISFLPDIVRNLLFQYNVPYTEEQAPSFLLLPVWKGPDGLVLWEGDGDNPWRDAWLSRNLEHSLTPILVPIGDLTDMSAISAQEAVNADAIKLQALSLRYGVDHVVVSVAESTGTASLSIGLKGETAFGYLDTVRSYQGNETSIAGAAITASVQVVRLLEESWKNQRAQLTSPTSFQNAITVAIPFDSFGEWNMIRSRIQQTYGVGDVQIDSLSAGGGIVRINYDGSLQEFSEELRRSGLVLSEVGGTWVIQPYY